VKKLSHLPVVVDPSHSAGMSWMVEPLSLAAMAVGADGIIVEVHCNPEKAFSDGAQTLYPEQFDKLMRDIDVLAPVVGKETTRIRNNVSCSACEVELPKNKKSDSVTCAFSGSRGAYAEIASQHYFDKQCESLSCANFREVFQAVVEGKSDYGMIPIENSLAGSVYDNYDNLIRFADVSICGSIKLRIEHALIGAKNVDIDSIKTVYSHPQGFAQCSEFLSKHPDWNLIECASTSEAACLVAKKASADSVAIASELAASVSKLEVIKTGIEDDPRNYTRFIVIKANNTSDSEKISVVADGATGMKLASVAFTTKNEPGALMNCLGIFNKSSMNLTRLESRPIHGQPWRYMFYVDIVLKESNCEGKEISEEALYKVINELKTQTEDVRLLGVYSEMN
jgi:prephenate dehydratase